MKPAWSTEQIAILRRHWPTEKPVVEIAAEIGKSPSAVKMKRRELGLTSRAGRRRRKVGVYLPEAAYRRLAAEAKAKSRRPSQHARLLLIEVLEKMHDDQAPAPR